MGRLSSPGERLTAFFFAPCPMYALVLARVILGLVLFCCYLNRLPDAQQLYGPQGLLGPELASQQDVEDLYGPAASFAAWGDVLRAVVPPPSEAGVWALLAVLLTCSLAFAVGCFTRTSGCIALALHHFFVAFLDPYSYWGWSVHIQPLLVYVLLAPTGRVLSVDAWRRLRRSGRTELPASAWLAPAWPLRLLQIHTCTMYAVTAWPRIDDSGWLRGEALFEVVTVALHAKFAIDWQPFKPLLSVGTYAAFVLEGLAPVLLWVPRLGPLWAYGLVAMHLGIELTTNVGWWSHIMIASLLAFLPASHLEALLRRLPQGLRALAPVARGSAPATIPRESGSRA